MGTCGTQKALKVLGNKWTLVVLRNLCTEPKRFNELLRAIDGISPKMLSERLKELVENGMVSKKVFPTTPPQVEYALLEKGKTLKPIIDMLDEWGDQLQV